MQENDVSLGQRRRDCVCRSSHRYIGSKEGRTLVVHWDEVRAFLSCAFCLLRSSLRSVAASDLPERSGNSRTSSCKVPLDNGEIERLRLALEYPGQRVGISSAIGCVCVRETPPGSVMSCSWPGKNRVFECRGRFGRGASETEKKGEFALSNVDNVDLEG